MGLASAANARDLDFKGVTVGATATPEYIKEKLGVKCGRGAENSQICNGPVTIGSLRATMNLVIDGTGIVQRIHLILDPRFFDLLAPTLAEKFGAPDNISTSVIQNQMGAKFAQVGHVWLGSNDTKLEYKKYFGRIDESSLLFSTKEDRAMFSKPLPKSDL
jgi:hypothetical protein